VLENIQHSALLLYSSLAVIVNRSNIVYQYGIIVAGHVEIESGGRTNSVESTAQLLVALALSENLGLHMGSSDGSWGSRMAQGTILADRSLVLNSA